jgi:DNA-directed RNA polymerase specialized sigma24 family protein
MEPHRDLELARAALSGEFAAFSKIFDACWPGVWALARRHAAGSEEAERLTHRILAAAFGRLEDYRGRSSLPAWFLAVARSLTPETECR